MLRLLIVMLLATVVILSGCANPGVSLTLTDSESKAIENIRTGQYTLISNKDLAELKDEAELGKSVGRYRLDKEGWRTWRLDTATGQMCLLLASDNDWKKATLAAQACNP
jgi:hypothetical protein